MSNASGLQHAHEALLHAHTRLHASSLCVRSETWSTWQAQLVYFARLGFPVAAFDMRGYGLSTSPQSVSAYSAKKLVADVLKIVQKLRAQADHEVVVVAHGQHSYSNVAFASSDVVATHRCAVSLFALYPTRSLAMTDWGAVVNVREPADAAIGRCAMTD